MGFRSVLAAAAAAAVALACAAPAGAVETGVNETLGPDAADGAEGRAAGRRLGAAVGDLGRVQPSPGVYDQRLIAGLNASAAALHARGIKALVVVHRAPAWASGVHGGIAPPRDPASFGAFMGGLAERVPGVDAWELWNEPDGPEFFGDGPQPARYAAMVRAAYPAIKAAQPDDVVVTGGTVGNDMDFVAGALRPRRAGPLRRGRRAHRHRLPDERPGRATTATSAAASAATRSPAIARSTR